MTRLFRRAYHRERVDAAASALTLTLCVQRKLGWWSHVAWAGAVFRPQM